MEENIILKYCGLRKKDANFLITTHYEIGNSEPIAKRIKDCLDVDDMCMTTGCKYAKGTKDPFNQ